MQNVQPSLIARDDTFLGVCEALGEDFGFNPLYLRVALGVSLLFNPAAVLGVYLGAGVVVALTRWLVPNPRPTAAPAQAGQPAAEPAPPVADNNVDGEPLPVAA